jgi:glycine/D-amino acid oxidase-like deaminating enzyme
MDLSYWEYKTWFTDIDFTIVGSGIVGLNCALALRKKYPKAKILILEKGILPQGASTKNAGFACFGSISEILEDLNHHTPDEVLQLVQKRWDGIELLRKNLGDKAIDYQRLGGHELFSTQDSELYNNCLEQLDTVNELLLPVFNQAAFQQHPNEFGFRKIKEAYVTNPFEAQINTGLMMQTLLNLVRTSRVTIMNATTVLDFTELTTGVRVKTSNFEFHTRKLLIATNGFASKWLNEEVKPARAQVLITKPIKGLKIKGTFHLDKGFYYFRNVEDRILFGGGRNLDLKTEETENFGITTLIQERLEELLRETILPDIHFEIEQRWSGIMGMGLKKRPVVKQLSDHVACGVRLGGMGIAIGSQVGKELADLT